MSDDALTYKETLDSSSTDNTFGTKKQKIFGRTLKKNLLVNIIGFLIGRASILQGITPFGIAYYAAVSGYRLNMFALFVSINVGILTVGMTSLQFKYMIAITLLGVANVMKPPNYQKSLNIALRSFVSVFIIGTLISLYNGFLLYDFILNVFEAFVVLIMVLLFRHALSVFQKEETSILSNEQVISITVLGILIISGISDVSVLGITLRNVLIISIIIILAFKNGPGVGSAIGLASGLIISMSGSVTPLIIGLYGFCGLLAGVFKDLGKIGSILGFLLANAIITIYMNGSTQVLIHIIDIASAAVIVCVIPKKFIDNMNSYFVKPANFPILKQDKSSKIKDITTKKLNDFSSSFYQLAQTFNKISEKNINVNKEDLSTLFEEVAERVCKSCSLNNICWNKEFYSTYQVMFNILERMEKKGYIAQQDVPKHFKDKCLRIKEFVYNTNFMFELYKANLMWQKKIAESRMLVSQQLEGVSNVISELAEEINVDISFKVNLERKIQFELTNNEIEVDEVMVVQNKYGKYEVSIAHELCGNKKVCSQQIIPIVSKVMGKNMVKNNENCDIRQDKDICVIGLSEQQEYKVVTGISSVAKSNDGVSGDSHKIIQLKEGKFIVALSDGMGSGEKARQESNAVLSLLAKFLESGFDKDLSIKLINSILVLKSSQESFTTIDLAIIDLFDAEVEFAKIGAATTFIRKSNKIKKIKSTSLPVGILNNVDIELSKENLNDEDIIVMVSDGVIDSNEDVTQKDEWILNELAKLTTKNPQEISDHILSKAKENVKDKQGDDMTVLVAKVSEKVC